VCVLTRPLKVGTAQPELSWCQEYVCRGVKVVDSRRLLDLGSRWRRMTSRRGQSSCSPMPAHRCTRLIPCLMCYSMPLKVSPLALP
jgi:hypothetical protein